jgi:hypothetical protein
MQQHRVFLLAKKAKDSLDQRLFLAIADRARGGQAGGKDRVVDGEGNEKQKGDKPDTRNKESHDLQHTVPAVQASVVKATYLTKHLTRDTAPQRRTNSTTSCSG